MKRSHNVSGYTNVDVLANQDLFPDEGYEFPPSKMHSLKNTRESSTQNPLNNKINDEAIKKAHEQLVTISKPIPPVDDTIKIPKNHRNKVIFESTINTRTKQIKYNEEIKKYQKESSKEIDLILQEQLKLSQLEIEKEEIKKINGMKNLSEAYSDQLFTVNMRKSKEREEERRYEEQILEADRKAKLEDEEKLKKLKELQKEKREEFEKKNQELLQLKKTKHEKEIEEELRLRKESAEDAERRVARNLEDERRRLEKTKLRARVVENQAKNLEQLKNKQKTEEAIAESLAQKNAEKDSANRIEKQKKLEEESKKEMERLKLENNLKNKKFNKKPFPTKILPENEEEIIKTQKKLENERYRNYQEKQFEINKLKEKENLIKELEEDKKLLEISKKQLTLKVEKLQNSIPQELNIKISNQTLKKTLKL